MTFLHLSFAQIAVYFILGVVLGTIYLTLLWLTIKNLDRVKHTGLFLFISALIRLVLFLSCALWFSQHNVTKFLLIVIGFVVTRYCVTFFQTRRRT